MNNKTNIYDKLKNRISPNEMKAMGELITNDPVKIYNTAVKRVPAYADFLREVLGEVPEVSTIEDFQKLPLTDKNNYLKKYPLERICLDGTMEGKSIVYMTSGTTQKSSYLAKLSVSEKFSPLWLYRELENNYNIGSHKNLIIVALPLGPWVAGGLITHSLHTIALESDNITLILPGARIKEILNILKYLCPKFDQTIIAGYSTFVKSAIEQAESEGIPLKNYNIKLMLVAEPYSREYRKRMREILGHKENDLTSIWSIYGACDFGTIGKETPFTIAAGNEIYKKKLGRSLFGQMEISSVCQYDERFLFIEEIEEELAVTRLQGVPTVRYKTGDRGKVFSFKSFVSLLLDSGIEMADLLEKYNVDKNTVTQAPIVVIFGRKGAGVKFRGTLIRVEQVVEILERSPALSDNFTDRFRLSLENDSNMEPVIKIILEKKPGARGMDINFISEIIGADLARGNTLYGGLLAEFEEKALPKIEIVKNGTFNEPKANFLNEQ